MKWQKYFSGSFETRRKKKSVKRSSFSSFLNLTSLGFSRNSSQGSNAEVVYVDEDNNTCYHGNNDERKDIEMDNEC